MPLPDSSALAKRLTKFDLVSTSVLTNLLKESQERAIHLSQLLVDRDILSDKDLGNIIADMLGVKFVQLSQVSIDQSVLMEIPEHIARTQKIIAFNQNENSVLVATTNPENSFQIDLLRKKFGKPIEVYFTTEREIETAINRYHLNMKEDIVDLLNQITNNEVADETASPIIEIINRIIEFAYHQRASDIHIEPEKESVAVRFRIDGILQEILTLPLSIQEQVISRIKVMSKLRTDEQQTAQDGKISYQMLEEDLDLRVSIVPVTHGEKIALRLLSAKSRQFGLLDLGFSEDDRLKLEQEIRKPHGMVLSTGPTGSGKTTTLYAILKLLNSPEKNIMTIEDPVEYDLKGINQIQVNEQTDLTFAEGLRSLVRQDPDIILVGEIRDEETAGIAVNASLTGHLVLSTLHTNDAVTTIPRMLDMGVEPYLVSSTVSVIIGQRLIRTICQNCRVSQEKNQESLGELISKQAIERVFGKKKTVRLYAGKGCSVCHNTGYYGRIGIFEVLIIDDEIKKMIADGKSIDAIAKHAEAQGMTTMLLDGLQKASRGLVTIEEVLRVTKE